MPNANFKDLTGQRFTRLLVLSLSDRKRTSRAYYWDVRCDCGVEKTVRGTELRNGKAKSCGCLLGQHMFRHGMEGTKIYNVWGSMKQRCQNPKHKRFSDYGGRGLTLCDEWQDFVKFFADMGEAPEGMELDRRDNDMGYSKANCRWVTPKQNANNRRKQR